jgi:dTMP kinase
LLLFEADRAQHLSDVILPALRRGEIVICDRYSDSTYAYQGFARGLGLDVVAMTDRIVTHGADPDVTILLDLPVEEGLARARKRGKVSRIDAESLRFHRKVRLGYLSLAKISSERVHIVHVRPDFKDTAELVHSHVSRMLRKGKC